MSFVAKTKEVAKLDLSPWKTDYTVREIIRKLTVNLTVKLQLKHHSLIVKLLRKSPLKYMHIITYLSII